MYMFRDVGRRIEQIVELMCIIGIGISVFIGIIILLVGCAYGDVDETFAVLGVVIGALTALVGSFVCWLMSLVLYGYGRLIQNSDRQTKYIETLICNDSNADVPDITK